MGAETNPTPAPAGIGAEFWQLLVHELPDGMLVLGRDGRILAANEAAETMFGYRVQDLIGTPSDLLLGDNRRGEGLFGMALDSDGCPLIPPAPFELTVKRADESLFQMEISFREMPVGDGFCYVGLGRNIATRKQAEARLRETERRWRNIAANMPGMVFQRVMRPDGKIEYPYVSEASRDLLDLEPSEIMADASCITEAISLAHRPRFISEMRRSARTLEPIDEDLLLTTRAGKSIWLRSRSRPRLLADGSVAWEGIMLDATQRKRAEEQLTFLAYYDSLTKLANRNLFLDKLAARLARAMIKQREAGATPGQIGGQIEGQTGEHIGVLSIGLDRFSVINTTFGDEAGDMVLATLAERLLGCLRHEGDIVARAGGDRFLMAVEGIKDEADLLSLIEEIVFRLQAPIRRDEEEFEITACIGYTMHPKDAVDAAGLVKHADLALHNAKSSGPGSLVHFEAKMNDAAARSLSLQHLLRRGLENGEFVPYFQPQNELHGGQIVGMEALVRWSTPRGLVGPSLFIPEAEESGLIDAIGEQVLRACAIQMRAWIDEGLEVVPVAVNVSGRQFHNPRRLVRQLETMLMDTNIEPRLIDIELTESSAMRDPEAAISIVRMLKDMGFACAIDDFGTGYSSLSVLKRFPIHKLKIDRSFVLDVATDPNDAAIVNAIVAMSHALRLKVVAEGVEARPILDFLRRLGCDQIQGYIFSKPLPASEMRVFLAERRKLAMEL